MLNYQRVLVFRSIEPIFSDVPLPRAAISAVTCLDGTQVGLQVLDVGFQACHPFLNILSRHLVRGCPWRGADDSSWDLEIRAEQLNGCYCQVCASTTPIMYDRLHSKLPFPRQLHCPSCPSTWFHKSIEKQMKLCLLPDSNHVPYCSRGEIWFGAWGSSPTSPSTAMDQWIPQGNRIFTHENRRGHGQKMPKKLIFPCS